MFLKVPLGFFITYSMIFFSGERIAIQGLTPDQVKPGSTVQLQVKGGGTQTLQLQSLQGLTVDPSKLTVLQELPEVGKVVIQEARSMGSDSITSILEEMKTENTDTITLPHGSMEYATAIPVAVTPLASDPKKTTIKRVAAPASTVFLPGNKTSRNIIFAGTYSYIFTIKILLLINIIKRFFFPDMILLFCYTSYR